MPVLMKTLLFALLGAASLAACAQTNTPATAGAPAAAAAAPASPKIAPGTPAARARAAILQVNPDLRIDSVGDAPLKGFQQVIVGGQVVYVSDDGRYLMQGALYDIAGKRDLSEDAMAGLRRELLKSMPVSDRIVFAPASPKYTVTVFTDVECGYCRKLHGEIAEYNRQGIAVQYVAFPRMGMGSADFRKMEAVWCAPDRKRALTDAKNDRPVPERRCTSPVAMQYTLGQRMGLTGTPMILAEDGTQLGGYVPPAQLRAELDRLAAKGEKPPVSRAASGV